MKRILLCLVVVALLGPSVGVRAAETGWLIAAVRVAGQFDLWALPDQGGGWRPLTATAGDERWPALHPSEPLLAFAARRDRNWDIYVQDLRTGESRRVTTSPHFDGWPAWSPDGRLAFASSRAGDLDIFVTDVNGENPVNLTPTSPAHDFDPAWESAESLLFVSTRDQRHVLYRLDAAGGEAEPLVGDRPAARGPGPDGAGRVLSIEPRGRDWEWVERDQDGRLLAAGQWAGTVTGAVPGSGGEHYWLEPRLEGVMLLHATSGGKVTRLNGPTVGVTDLAWGQADADLMEARLGDVVLPPRPAASGGGRLAPVSGVAVEMSRLNDQVLPAFQRLRARIIGESGIDFLSDVSELLRPVDFASENSDYLSWHKSGRAMDTLLDLGWSGGRQRMEIVREDRNGDVYWRVWIRCPAQDGSCGEPLVDAPWDLSFAARWEDPEGIGNGGVPKSFQPGYYFDFTRLAEDEGWERIGSYEGPDFDWRSNKTALEYWHLQMSGGLSWYEAMLEVYGPDVMEEWFDLERLVARSTSRWLLVAKGFPLPPAWRLAPADIVVP